MLLFHVLAARITNSTRTCRDFFEAIVVSAKAESVDTSYKIEKDYADQLF